MKEKKIMIFKKVGPNVERLWSDARYLTANRRHVVFFCYIDTTFLYYQNPKSLIAFFIEQSSSIEFHWIPRSGFSGSGSFNHVLFQQHVFPVFSSSFTDNSYVHTMSFLLV